MLGLLRKLNDNIWSEPIISGLMAADPVDPELYLFESFYDCQLDPAYAERFSKDGHKLYHYSVTAYILPDNEVWLTDGSGEINIFYSDSKYGFVLESQQIPIAAIAFEIQSDVVIYVNQIQGRNTKIRGKPEELQLVYKELQKVRWQRLLLSYLTDWARAHGAAQVRVHPAKKNQYYYPYARNEHEQKLNERLETHYDATARSLGFTLSDDEEYYYLDL